MKRLQKKKIILLVVCFLLLLGGIFLKIMIEQEKNKKIELGESIYQQIHELYFYGKGIQYEVDEENKRVFMEKDDKKYYAIKNYDEIFFHPFTKSMLQHVHDYFHLIQEDEKYYIQDVGRGLSGYYGTALKIKKYSKNKITFTAQSKFCEGDYLVTYGDGCRENHYYTVDKPFIIVKEKDTWKVSEYTSVFEFSDSEFQ